MRRASCNARAIVATAVLLTIGLSAACLAGPEPSPSTSQGSAPLPDDRLGVRTAPILLLSRPDVRADLGLNPRLAEEAEMALSDLYVRAAALKGKSGAQAVAARQAIDDAQRRWFQSELTLQQRNRLVQIDLQWEGPSALVSRPVVADTLDLSPDQRAALADAVKKRREARSRPGPAQADEPALTRQALAVLTPSQRELWRSMLGQPFVPRLASAKPDGAARR